MAHLSIWNNSGMSNGFFFLQNAYWDVLVNRIYTQPILFKVVPITHILREDTRISASTMSVTR
jgi:hypothetical protein